MRNYNNFDVRVAKPAVISQTGADQNFHKWLKESSYNELLDADGIKWNLEIRDRQIPDPYDIHQSVWYVTIDVWSNITRDLLINTETLDRRADARLIALLGSDIIKMQMKPIELRDHGLDRVRSKLVEKISRLRDEFAGKSLHVLKRQLVGRWIEKKQVFGQHGASTAVINV